jgi:hypothetical protein
MIYPERLTEETFPRFVDNIKNKVNMWCLAYYSFGLVYARQSFEEENTITLDICHTHYFDGGVCFGARGITYFSVLPQVDDITVDDLTFKSVSKHIHAFIEVREPEL